VRLTTGVELGLAPGNGAGLRGASTADLKVIEVEAFVLGIHFPRRVARLYVPARSAAKAAASRANGKRGGQPRRVAVGDGG